MNRFSWPAVKQLLYNHYSAPLMQTFRQFRTGTIFFAVGLIIIYLALTALPASAKQELILLCGLLIAGAGFVIAILAHIRMIISRIIRFFNDK